MSKEIPDYQDAKLVLRLYELRREAVMRQSRDTLNREFFPATYEEFEAVTRMDHPMNVAFRQVSSYWEMAYGFAKHGIVNAEFLAENTGEGMFLYSKVAPFIEQFRAGGMITVFQNSEWIVHNTNAGKHRFEMMRKRIETVIAQRK